MSSTETLTRDAVGHTTAMATAVTVRAVPRNGQTTELERAVDAALAVFHRVDATCTRFDPASPLMRANASPTDWHALPDTTYDAIREAHRAYQRTSGSFDPRVLDDLVRLGYATSMRAGVPAQVDAPEAATGRGPLPDWRPGFRDAENMVRLGDRAVDLGGIGKGLAVRWAAQVLSPFTSRYLVEAGGDCYCGGEAPDGGGWRVGIEDPHGGQLPVAVLHLINRAAATSSVRVRQWYAGDEQVHHLVDPRTGRPGGEGLLAVTVVDRDPADAEVWSKTLFLQGRDRIAAAAEYNGLAALWIDAEGRITESARMKRYVIWRLS